MFAPLSRTLAAVSALLILGASVVQGACPSGIAGYSITTNLEVAGADLNGPFNDVQSAINSCNSQADCQGVAGSDTVFMTKTRSMVPTSASVGACVYVKLPTVCPPQAGYTAIGDVDSQGTVYGSSPYPAVGSARSACEGGGDCLGFDSKSFTARSSLFPMAYSRGTCFYVKLPTNCPDVSGYTATPDVYISDNSIDVKKPAELPNCCNTDDKCIGYMSNGERKLSADSSAYRRGACWYKKSTGPTSCPDVAGYAAKPDQDLATSVLKKYASSAAAAADCANNATCGGFTSNGWRTRKDGTKLMYAFASCFYVKTACASADVSVNCTITPGSFVEVCASGYTNYDAATRKCSVVDTGNTGGDDGETIG